MYGELRKKGDGGRGEEGQWVRNVNVGPGLAALVSRHAMQGILHGKSSKLQELHLFYQLFGYGSDWARRGQSLGGL